MQKEGKIVRVGESEETRKRVVERKNERQRNRDGRRGEGAEVIFFFTNISSPLRIVCLCVQSGVGPFVSKYTIYNVH